MELYLVGSLQDVFYIKADKWDVSAEGLKFYQGDKIVAWFTTWEYWRISDPDYDC